MERVRDVERTAQHEANIEAACIVVPPPGLPYCQPISPLIPQLSTNNNNHSHTTIGTVVLILPGTLDYTKLNSFMAGILWPNQDEDERVLKKRLEAVMAIDALKVTNDSNGNDNSTEPPKPLDISEPNTNEPNTMQLFRVKGILSVRDDTTQSPETNTNTDRQYILQAVNDLWDIRPCDSSIWQLSEERYSKLIFIGKFLNWTVLEDGLKSCLV